MKFNRHSSEDGLTLIESLVAIAVIGIVLAAIAPPLLIATATRLHNQRTEQALQLAQAEVERVRSIVERHKYDVDTNSYQPYQLGELPPISSATLIQNTSAPTTGVSGYETDRTRVTATKGLVVDVNNDKFVIQAFRNSGITETRNGINTPVAFNMVVRVYDYQAFVQNTALNIKRPSLGLTTGRNLKNPLAIVYTSIIRADRRDSLEQYERLLLP